MQQNRELNILKWVGIALACLSTLFTLAIVGSHLTGRLVGLGKVGIVGTIGAEFVVIICAWLVGSERKAVAGTAMICQIVLTAVLLVNASIALDLDWQENLANKAAERQLLMQRATAEEQRKLIEKQAELAGQLAQTDKRLAREFVKGGPKATAKPAEETTPEVATAGPVNVAQLGTYERYGLTVIPLFLALLVVVFLGLAAHVGRHHDANNNGVPDWLEGGWQRMREATAAPDGPVTTQRPARPRPGFRTATPATAQDERSRAQAVHPAPSTSKPVVRWMGNRIISDERKEPRGN